MKVVVVGLGVQGKKRLAVAGSDVAATVDPVAPEADHRCIEQVPLHCYDAAIVSVPDAAKPPILRYLLGRGKHVLVEKPLLHEVDSIQVEAARAGVTCYTAYNHRFEPNIIRLRDAVRSGILGRIHLAKFCYGNGTAADVRRSPWRDRGLGVVADLGSHLLDLADLLLGRPAGSFRLWSLNRFENRAPDHAVLGNEEMPRIILETSLIAWRNTFQIDLFGDQGSAHVEGLCKWGPSRFLVRRRVLPSGKPPEEGVLVEQPDPTWAAEYRHFLDMCRTAQSNLDNDIWMAGVFRNLQDQAEGQRWAA
jgi:predicted dehydrogenase